MGVADKLPLYQAVGRVRACKIASIERTEDGFTVWPSERDIDPIAVPFDFVSKRAPKPGGYLIVRDESYFDFATARVFESGHLRCDDLASRRDTLERQLADLNAAIAANKESAR